MHNKQSNKLKESARLDQECIKCKNFLGKCDGRMTGKAIPCLCFKDKECEHE